MAGKITIRRVGSIFPAISLVVIVFLFGIFIWLSTAGLPDCALRAIEQEAAKHGINLQIGGIQLAPKSGLAVKAENVRVTLPRQGAEPVVATIRKLQTRFRFHELLTGKKTPQNIILLGGHVQLPLSENENDSIKLRQLDAEVLFRKETPDMMQVKADALLEEIHLAFFANIPLNKLSDGKESDEAKTELQVDKLLAEHGDTLRKIRQLMHEQNWDNDTRPSITLGMDMRQEAPRFTIRAEAPQFIYNDICMKDANLQASFRDNNFIINSLSFRTEDPDTTILVRGGYDLDDRLLDFNASSTAPIFSILQKHYPSAEIKDILTSIKLDEGAQPGINLRGSIRFSEDYALQHVNLRGLLEQKGMYYGDSRLDHTILSFYLNDGNIHIDKLQLTLPDGHIQATAGIQDGTGNAQLQISLPITTLKSLAADIARREISLPEELALTGRLNLAVSSSMKVATFNPGVTRWEDLIPDPKDFSAEISLDEIDYKGTVIAKPHLQLKLNDIDLSLRNPEDLHISHWEVKASAGALQMEDIAHADTLSINLRGQDASCHFDNPEESLRLGTLAAEIESSAVNVEQIALSQASLKLDHAKDWKLDKSIPQLLKGCNIDIKAASCKQEKHFDISNIHITPFLEDENQGTLSLRFDSDGCTLAPTISIRQEKSEQGTLLHYSVAPISLPLAKLSPTLKAIGFETSACKLPEMLHLQTEGTYNVTANTPASTRVQLHIPELRRTPGTVPVFRGLEIPLEIRADITLEPNEQNDICYRGDVWAKHETGVFEGKVDGNASSFCHVTGNNTILPDVVDALIDDVDAHSILRDFRFTHGTSTVDVTDIDTTVRYDNGICVFSKCNARIRNTEFLLSAIQDTEKGGEKMRTDMGSNPYTRVHEATCGVEVDVRWYRKDEQGKPIPDVSYIHLTKPYLHYDNRPWLKKQKITDGEKESKLNGRLITFNLEDCTIALHDIKGRVYPAYSFGMFYSDLQEFMKDVILRKPAIVDSKYCLFPIARRCTVPMTGLIRAEAPRDAAFRFLGTTIPLQDFSGFINISDDDVYLDHMNAACWGGTLDAAVRIGFSGPRTTLDGYVQAGNMNLKHIAAAYDVDFSDALCNGNIRFRTKSTDLDDIQAYGRVSIENGDLLQMRIFRPLGAFISDMGTNLGKLQNMVSSTAPEERKPGFFSRLFTSIFSATGKAVDKVTDGVSDTARKVPFVNHFIAYDIQHAHTNFDIINGWLITRNMKATGYNLNVKMQLGINLDTLDIKGNLWPAISSVPTVILSPLTFLSDYMIDIILYGNVENIQWKFALDRKINGSSPSLTDKPQKKEDKP